MAASTALPPVLPSTARALVPADKGILAADESIATLARRFAQHHIPFTRETRQAYRELILTTPGLGDYISGAILFEETLQQPLADGSLLPSALVRQAIIPGVKVDTGARALPNFPPETTTRGLDNLRARLTDYVKLGARFTKWRAMFVINDTCPSGTAIETNARLLALFAATSQEAGLVPIVEPEIMMTGDHALDQSEAVSALVLRTVFARLAEHRVKLNGMLLKTAMVLPGEACAAKANEQEVAEATLRALRAEVPAATAGIVFLSGGQSDVDASERLNAICAQRENAPWPLSFSFGRALQDAAMRIWAGKPANLAAAQAELLRRAQLNALAVQGNYPVGSERTPT